MYLRDGKRWVVLAASRIRLILGARRGFLKRRQQATATPVPMSPQDRGQTQPQWNQEVVWRGEEGDRKNKQAVCQKIEKTRR